MNDRRTFLKNLARIALLGGLASGVAKLASRKTSSAERNDVCARRDGVCRHCPVLKGCGHPNALSFKEQPRRLTQVVTPQRASLKNRSFELEKTLKNQHLQAKK